MKPEYDFSNAERGKFYKANAAMRLPIYLDAEIQSYLVERAVEKSMPLNEMVNELLRREIESIELGKA